MKTVQRAMSEDGVILVSTLLVLLAMTTLGIVIANTTTGDVRLAANYRDAKQAFFASEAGTILALEEGATRQVNDLLDGADGVTGTSDDGLVDFVCCGTQVDLAGNASFQVTIEDDKDEVPNDPSQDSNGRVFLRSDGFASMGSRWHMEVLARKVCDEAGKGNLRAAVSTNGPINSKGNLIIDGRDHELDGDVIPNMGTLGVSTKSTYDREGASLVGGTDRTGDPAADIAPTRVGIENIIEEHAAWEAPLTPEAVLEMTEGRLKEIALSGHNGSQYTTDPARLTMPLSGVTYVEMPGCGTWDPAQVVGEGVLVVHDKNTCSIVKNFHAMSYFNGILVADDLIHLDGNGALMGAVFVLTQSPSAGNCIGNGTLDVLYSTQAIDNALDSLRTCTMEILSWKYE